MLMWTPSLLNKRKNFWLPVGIHSRSPARIRPNSRFSNEKFSCCSLISKSWMLNGTFVLASLKKFVIFNSIVAFSRKIEVYKKWYVQFLDTLTYISLSFSVFKSWWKSVYESRFNPVDPSIWVRSWIAIGKGGDNLDYAAFRTCKFLLPSFAHIVSKTG